MLAASNYRIRSDVGSGHYVSSKPGFLVVWQLGHQNGMCSNSPCLNRGVGPRSLYQKPCHEATLLKGFDLSGIWPRFPELTEIELFTD